MTTEVPPPPVEHDPEALEDIPRADPVPTSAASEPKVVKLEEEQQEAPKDEQAATPALAPIAGINWEGSMALLALASWIEVIAAGVELNNPTVLGIPVETRQYQVALGCIAAILSSGAVVAHKSGKFDSDSGQEILSAFLFVWCTAGAIVNTFFGSFQTTLAANGYFSSWAMFIFATLSLLVASRIFRKKVDEQWNTPRTPLVYLLAASTLVMAASIGPCSGTCSSIVAWAVAASVISMVVCIAMLVGTFIKQSEHYKWAAIGLLAWWFLATCTLTFGAGPFVLTGNGYFGCFAALTAALYTCRYYFDARHVDDKLGGAQPPLEGAGAAGAQSI